MYQLELLSTVKTLYPLPNVIVADIMVKITKFQGAEAVKNGIEARRESSRRQIMFAAMDLFYEKGYQKTTTRDIICRAGILNGSLYNRFKSKEDILLSIVHDALGDALGESGKLFAAESNPLVAALLPGALEIYVSSRDLRLADILYEAHHSWTAVESYIEAYGRWSADHLERFGFQSGEGGRLKIISIVGAVGNIAGYYLNGGTAPIRDSLSGFVSLSAGVFRLPVLDVQDIVDRLIAILESGDVIICGHAVTANGLDAVAPN